MLWALVHQPGFRILEHYVPTGIEPDLPISQGKVYGAMWANTIWGYGDTPLEALASAVLKGEVK